MSTLKQNFLGAGCRGNVHLAFEKDGKTGGVTFICTSDAQLDTLLLALLPLEKGENKDLAKQLFAGNIGKFNIIAAENTKTGVPISFEEAIAKIPVGATIKNITTEKEDILLGSPYFSTQENTLDVIKALVEKTEKISSKEMLLTTPSGDDIEKDEIIIGSIGYSRFVQSLGKKDDGTSPFVVPFDANEGIETSTTNMLEREKSLSENLRRSEADIRACYEHEASTWNILTDIGSAVHAVFEAVMKDENIPSEVGKFLNEEQIEKAKKEANNLKSAIKTQYPDCTILTEVKIISKNLDPDLIKAIHTKYPDVNSINGRIDLLVIDKNNNAHIYDYKVSRKGIGVWDIQENGILADNFYWTSEKKRDVTQQLAVYAQILKQYGISVLDCNILPIKITPKYDDSGLVISEFDKPSKDNKGKIIKTGYTVTGLESIDVHYDPNHALVDGQTVYKISKTLEGNIYRNVARMIPSDLDIKGLNLEKSYNQFKKIFPGSKVGDQIAVAKNDNKDVDFYINNKKNWDTIVDDNGKTRFRFYNGKSYEYANTLDELRSIIGAFIKRNDNIRSSELLNISNAIKTALKSGKIDDFTSGFDNNGKALLINTFNKYITNKWELIEDNSLIAAGIFIFKKDDRMEIQVFSNLHLTQLWPGSFGNTILGEKRRNEQCSETMEATTAHLEGLKAMIILANNSQILQGFKVRSISIINPGNSQIVDTVFNKAGIDNYNKLRIHFKEIDLPSLNTGYFVNTERALLESAQEKLANIQQTSKIDLFNVKYDANNISISSDGIATVMTQLRAIGAQSGKHLYDIDKYHAGDPLYDAYWYLWQLYLHLNGVNFISESDKEKGFNGLNPSGTYITSANFSSSKNLQIFGQMQAKYEREVRDKFNDVKFEVQKLVIDLEKRSGNYGRDLGRTFIRKKADGTIADTFEFIHPEELSGSKADKIALESILELLGKARNPNGKNADRELAKQDGTYYEIPLMKAASVQRKYERENGLLKSIKEGGKDDVQTTVAELTEEDVAAREVGKNSERHGVYNPFNITRDERKRRLSKHGVDYFEQNLETVIAKVLFDGARSEISEKYGLIFRGMQLAARRSSSFGGIKMDNIEETLDKLISNRFYGNTIMENPRLYQALSPVMSAFSTLRIGGNIKGFLRESVSGVYAGATRAAAGMLDGFTEDNYGKAVQMILEDLPNNFSGISKIQQLNAIYGMANQGGNGPAESAQVNGLKPGKWSKSTLFLNTTAPDYQHRNAILIAKMMGDGCGNAHTLDASGKLKYDMFKDDRFKIFLSKNTEHKDYLKQKALYYKYVAEGNKIHPFDPTKDKTKDGAFGILPQAYPPREAESIKNFGDLLYGHYDPSSKSLMDDTFLGSFFMQFKTYATAKIEQGFMKGDTYNIGKYKELRDPDTGELIYEKVVIGDSAVDIPGVERITESEGKKLSKEEQAEYNIAVEGDGEPMEGILGTAFHMGKALFSDRAEFEKMGNDPRKRAILKLGCYDLLILGLIEFIVCLLGGTAKGKDAYTPSDVRTALRKEGGYMESLCFNIFTGAIDDHNIFSTLNNLTDISVLSLTQSYTKNTMNLLSGNQSGFSFMTKFIGPLSELQGLAAQASAE